MRKTVSIMTALALAMLLTTAELTAQQRINFRRGSSSASVRGKIGVNRGVAGANYRSYVVRAGAGQTISATVSSANGKVAFAENDLTSYTIDTDTARDYVIHLYNGGATNTTYTLTVSIR
jgi:DNA-binding transcriptional regulator of glucitol operon